MSKRRVVVTGVGMLTPLGNTVQSTWDACLAGQNGISTIEHFDTTNFAAKIAGMVKDFDAGDLVPKKDARKMDLFIQYGIVAADQAIKDSGIEAAINPENCHRYGVAIGSGIGGITTIETNVEAYLNKGARRISPFFVPSSIVNMVAGHVSINYGLRGPNIAISTACATGLHNIGHAARMIAYGDADAMIAGGSEKASTPLAMGGFGSAKALSFRNDDPEHASRPWDEGRDGFVLGDGAGMMVLEEYEHAKARGAKIYAEVAGFGMSGDAYHITATSKDGSGAALCMEAALRDAAISVDKVGYINAHGTSTPVGDLSEVLGVKRVFGDAAKKVMMSSTKSMMGHLLGASGSVETVITALALKDQMVPPTRNLENPSEGCDLDFVADGAREVNIEYAMSNSFGFGGTNGSIILKRV